MIGNCATCGLVFDDEKQSPACPHGLISYPILPCPPSMFDGGVVPARQEAPGESRREVVFRLPPGTTLLSAKVIDRAKDEPRPDLYALAYRGPNGWTIGYDSTTPDFPRRLMEKNPGSYLIHVPAAAVDGNISIKTPDAATFRSSAKQVRDRAHAAILAPKKGLM